MEENYEQCSFIQTAIDLYLENIALMISEKSTKPLEEIYNVIREQSDLIFLTLKKHEMSK